MPQQVTTRDRTPWRGGLAALVGTPAMTVWGEGGAPDPKDPNNRWTLGYQSDPVTCTEGWRWDPTCDVQMTTQVDINGDVVVVLDEPKPMGDDRCDVPLEHPFGIGTTSSCSIIGKGQTKDELIAVFTAEALAAYDRIRWREFGREIWAGDITQARANAFGTTLDSFLLNDSTAGQPCGFVELCPGVAVASAEALFELEQFAMARSDDSVSVIHADFKTLGRWLREGLVEKEGLRFRTKLTGSYVVAEKYYTGDGPVTLGNPQPTPGESWAYVTGPLEVRFYPPKLFPPPDSEKFWEAVDRNMNDIAFRVEGLASATWKCVHAGIRVAPCDDSSPSVVPVVPTPRPGARFEISKAGIPFPPATGSPWMAGDEISYTFTITNTGIWPLTDFVIYDNLIPGFNPSAVFPLNLQPGDVNTITTGLAFHYTVTAADLALGYVRNDAFMTAVDPGVPGSTVRSNDVTHFVSMTVGPRVLIEKSAVVFPTGPGGSAQVGDIVRYTFTVYNAGTTGLQNVFVDDPFLSLFPTQVADLPNPSDQTTLVFDYTLTAVDISAGAVGNLGIVNADEIGGAGTTNDADFLIVNLP